jgi:protein O-mannosyl-transferase
VTADPASQEFRRGNGQSRLGAWVRSPVGFLSLVAIACVVVYLPARNAPFVLDDYRNIEANPHVRMTRLDLPSLWRAMVPYENLNLRPLSFLTFALNHLFGGLDPFGYHAVNLAVLLLSIPAAYLLVRLLSGVWLSSLEASAASLGVTALWVLHPLLTNGVSYIVQRMTALYTLFSLAALLFFVSGRISGRVRSYAFAGVSLLCSLASKETALFTPLLALLILWLLPREKGGLGARAAWALAGFSAASQAAMVLAAQYSVRMKWVPQEAFGTAERLMTEGRVVMRYLELFVLPLPSRLNLDYTFPISTSLLSPLSTLLAAAFHVSLIAFAVWVRARRPLFTIGILGFYLLQLPEGTFMPLDLIFEHRAYFPAFFLSLALMDLLLWGFGRLRLARPERGALIVAAAVAALCGVFGYQRNQVWADPLRLGQDTVAKSPASTRARLNLSVQLIAVRRYDEAVEHLREALRIDPDLSEIHLELSRALQGLGRNEEALQEALTAVAKQSNSPEANNNLGMTYAVFGRFDQAIVYLRKALQLKPDYFQALNNLAGVSYRIGRYEEALELYRKALALMPEDAATRFNVGISLLKLGRVAEVAVTVHTLERVDPALALRLKQRLAGTGG